MPANATNQPIAVTGIKKIPDRLNQGNLIIFSLVIIQQINCVCANYVPNLTPYSLHLTPFPTSFLPISPAVPG